MPKDDKQRTLATSAVRKAILNANTFAEATLHALEGDAPWQRVLLRPVVIRGQARVQISRWDGVQDRVSNLAPQELADALDELLADSWQRIHVRATDRDVHVRVTKKAKVLLTSSPSSAKATKGTSHDHRKQRLLDPVEARQVLQAIGVVDGKGRIRPAMRRKYRQIESFCGMIDGAVSRLFDEDEPIHIMDCGCGSAYLTMAAYHVLANKRGRSVKMEGVDTNAGLIAKVRDQVLQLGYEGTSFTIDTIADVQPETAPNVVLSLHACDTATDEALARGVIWESQLILSAPCCQHELHDQLHADIFRPVLRHGILRERMADILTDSLRALVLRIMGYRTSVVEFVDPAQTSRNIMIQAEKGLAVGDPQLVAEYRALTEFWQVEPILARLLGDQFAEALGNLHKA